MSIYIIPHVLAIEFLVQEILQLNIASQDSDSDDDISALSGSESDILETVEKANFVEFLVNNSSTLAGVKGIKIHRKPLYSISIYFLARNCRKELRFFTMPNKVISPKISTPYSIIKKTEVAFCSFSPDPIS